MVWMGQLTMAEIQPFDLGRILQKAEVIKAAREANSLEAAIAPFAVQQSRDAQAIRQGEMQDAGLQRTQNYARLALGVMKDQPAQNWGAALGIVKRLGGDVSAFPEQFDQNAYSAVQALAAGDVGGAQNMLRQVSGSGRTVSDEQGNRYYEFDVLDGGGARTIRQPIGGDILTKQGETIDEQRAAEVAAAGQKASVVDQAKAAVERRVSQIGGLSKLSDAELSYGRLVGGDLSKIYGRGEGLWPDLLRSQDGIDLMAERDRFVGLLTMAGRQDLKGQGSVTESEVNTLARSQSILSNPNVSPSAARAALDEAMNIFRRNAGLAEYIVSGGSTSSANRPPDGRPAAPGEVRGRFDVRVKK